MKALKNIIGKWAFNYQSNMIKPKSFENLTFQFLDSKGRKYYKYHDIFNFDLGRKEQLTIKLQELNARTSVLELDQMFGIIQKSIDDGFKGANYGGCIAKISNICYEWKVRREELNIYAPAFIDIAALFYVREDENVESFDVEIHNQKIEQFKKDYEGIKEFFFTQELNQLLGLQEITPEELKKLYLENEKRLQQLQKLREKFILNPV